MNDEPTNFYMTILSDNKLKLYHFTSNSLQLYFQKNLFRSI